MFKFLSCSDYREAEDGFIHVAPNIGGQSGRTFISITFIERHCLLGWLLHVGYRPGPAKLWFRHRDSI